MSLPDGWEKTSAADDPEMLRVEHVLARWRGPLSREVTLNEDGTLFTVGVVPIEIVPYVMAEWLVSQRGKIA